MQTQATTGRLDTGHLGDATGELLAAAFCLARATADLPPQLRPQAAAVSARLEALVDALRSSRVAEPA